MSKMVFDIGELTFIKYPKASTINVYFNDVNTDCFTDYSIKTDFEKFEASCKDYYNYSINESEEI